jgi:TorA maturation chaperone TorD
MNLTASAENVRRRAVDDVDLLRAREYALLGRLMARAPDGVLLGELAGLGGDGTTPIGRAHAALAAAAREAEPQAVRREYFTLFVGVGRGELLPYGSYYRTGFLNERPLAEVRRDLARLGVARAEGLHDPEDHVAILCDVMAALADGTVPADAVSERDFFARHLAPWAGRFFTDLAGAPSAGFYRAVGELGATFVAIEAQAFALDG